MANSDEARDATATGEALGEYSPCQTLPAEISMSTVVFNGPDRGLIKHARVVRNSLAKFCRLLVSVAMAAKTLLHDRVTTRYEFRFESGWEYQITRRSV